MRTGVTVLGIILLVLGGIFFYMPTATTSGVGATDTGSKPFWAAVTIPAQFTIALIIIGALLMLIGLLMPDPIPKVYVENNIEPEHRSDEVVYEERTRRRVRHH